MKTLSSLLKLIHLLISCVYLPQLKNYAKKRKLPYYHSNLLSRLLVHGYPEGLFHFTELKVVGIEDFTYIMVIAKPISCCLNLD